MYRIFRESGLEFLFKMMEYTRHQLLSIILTEGHGHVVFINTVVTTIVHLETFCLVEKIMVNMKPAAPIIVVYTLCSIVIGNDKIVSNDSWQRIKTSGFPIFQFC